MLMRTVVWCVFAGIALGLLLRLVEISFISFWTVALMIMRTCAHLVFECPALASLHVQYAALFPSDITMRGFLLSKITLGCLITSCSA